MQAHAIPARTEAGRVEIEQRSQRLSPGVRSVLLLVDGRRSVVELEAIAKRFRAPEDSLAQLVRHGLVATGEHEKTALATPTASQSDPQRYLILYALMTDASRAHLSLVGAYLTQMKIERAADAAALEALLPALQSGVAKVKGVIFAEELAERIRAAAGL